nr:hypothetical protein [Sphingomonas sanguinis]
MEASSTTQTSGGWSPQAMGLVVPSILATVMCSVPIALPSTAAAVAVGASARTSNPCVRAARA